MYRIGTVNIDTSHASAFAEIFLKSGVAKYTCVYNDGFRTDDEVDNFIKAYGLEKRYYELSEMAKNVDLVFIQGCNWDRHIEMMTPFVEAGVPVFVDKPMVGNVRDIKSIEKMCADGAKLIGTSAMRYTYEHKGFFELPADERGEVTHISATVGVDEFNYAIHAVESILGFTEKKPLSVFHAGEGIHTDTYFVEFEDGVSAVYTTSSPAWQPSTATVMTTKTTYSWKIDSSKVYEAMLVHVCAYLEGKENCLASVESMLDGIRIMLAGKKSKSSGKRELISELSESDEGFDGSAFEKLYESQQRA